MKKRYERPMVLVTYDSKELRAEAAQVVASSYGGGDPNWPPRYP